MHLKPRKNQAQPQQHKKQQNYTSLLQKKQQKTAVKQLFQEQSVPQILCKRDF